MGVYATTYDNFPLGQWVDKGLRVQAGQATVHNYIDELMQMIVSGKVRADDIISHRLPLSRAAEGYRLHQDRAQSLAVKSPPPTQRGSLNSSSR